MKRKLKNGLELDLEAGMLEVYIWQKNGGVRRTEKAKGGYMLFAGSEMER